jgi:hypothetical protein
VGSYIPEDYILYSDRHENLKSYNTEVFWGKQRLGVSSDLAAQSSRCQGSRIGLKSGCSYPCDGLCRLKGL